MKKALSGDFLRMRFFALLFIFLIGYSPSSLADTFVLPPAVAPSVTTAAWIGAQWKDPPGSSVFNLTLIDQKIGADAVAIPSTTWSGDANSGSGQCQAYADFGSIRLYAAVSREGDSSRSDLDMYSFRTYAYGRFTETMIIDDPLLHGQPGTTTFDFTIDGISGKTGSGSGQAQFYVKPFAPTDQGYRGFDILASLNGPVDETTDPIDFIYGEPFSFYVSMFVSPSLAGTGPGSSYFDTLHTLTMDGIHVFDQDGNTVADYSIETASGARYPFMSAVPEPFTLQLLGLGLIGLAGMRRKIH